MITFGPDDTEVEISFNVTDDLIALEPTETLIFSLALVTMTDRASVTPFNTATILIVDDDGKRSTYRFIGPGLVQGATL